MRSVSRRAIHAIWIWMRCATLCAPMQLCPSNTILKSTNSFIWWQKNGLFSQASKEMTIKKRRYATQRLHTCKLGVSRSKRDDIVILLFFPNSNGKLNWINGVARVPNSHHLLAAYFPMWTILNEQIHFYPVCWILWKKCAFWKAWNRQTVAWIGLGVDFN